MISTRLGGMTDVMARPARRELTVPVTGTERQDEIGETARAVQVFKDGLIETDRLTAAQAAEQAAKQRRADNVDKLVRDFESAASELDATTHSMSGMAQQASSEAATVAAAAEQTSADVDRFLSAIKAA
jgi:methyl-accepting chemotaxis protein